ncbi:hypothetical protein AMK28_21320 [Streptomyces sp. CB02115]|nr:hypothetical protein AMK28_21320 [Streptomyces sp. CB02115]
MASKYGRHNGGGPPIVNRYPGVTSVRGSAASGEHTAALTTLIRTGNNEFTGQFEVAEVWFSGLDEANRQRHGRSDRSARGDRPPRSGPERHGCRPRRRVQRTTG